MKTELVDEIEIVDLPIGDFDVLSGEFYPKATLIAQLQRIQVISQRQTENMLDSIAAGDQHAILEALKVEVQLEHLLAYIQFLIRNQNFKNN